MQSPSAYFPDHIDNQILQYAVRPHLLLCLGLSFAIARRTYPHELVHKLLNNLFHTVYANSFLALQVILLCVDANADLPVLLPRCNARQSLREEMDGSVSINISTALKFRKSNHTHRTSEILETDSESSLSVSV